jgi:hypothetical protein
VRLKQVAYWPNFEKNYILNRCLVTKKMLTPHNNTVPRLLSLCLCIQYQNVAIITFTFLSVFRIFIQNHAAVHYCLVAIIPYRNVSKCYHSDMVVVSLNCYSLCNHRNYMRSISQTVALAKPLIPQFQKSWN